MIQTQIGNFVIKTLIGFVWGELRHEDMAYSKGPDIYDKGNAHILFNCNPEKIMGHDYIIPHVQKKSNFGFLVTWPFCFHIWFFWKKQEYGVLKNENGPYPAWLAGTEKGIYFRTPGYRIHYGIGTIWTNGFLGGHWD